VGKGGQAFQLRSVSRKDACGKPRIVCRKACRKTWRQRYGTFEQTYGIGSANVPKRVMPVTERVSRCDGTHMSRWVPNDGAGASFARDAGLRQDSIRGESDKKGRNRSSGWIPTQAKMCRLGAGSRWARLWIPLRSCLWRPPAPRRGCFPRRSRPVCVPGNRPGIRRISRPAADSRPSPGFLRGCRLCGRPSDPRSSRVPCARQGRRNGAPPRKASKPRSKPPAGCAFP